MKKLIYAGVLIGLTSIAYAFVSKAPLKPFCVTLTDKGARIQFNIDAQNSTDAQKRALAQNPTMKPFGVQNGRCK
jgi:hypothetical protein